LIGRALRLATGDFVVMRFMGIFSVFVAVFSGFAQAGSVSGTIKFEGAAPAMKPYDVKSDPVCAAKQPGGTVLGEVLVLGEGQTMANVFVEVIGGLPEKEWPVPTEPVILTQEGCQYKPHVFGVRAGQTLRVLNPDGTIHNVNGAPTQNPPFNFGMPKNLEQKDIIFEKPEGLFPIMCNVHNWMRTYCAVMAHPFYTVTEKDGKYVIDGLEPGEYEIRATHERLGAQTAKVTVSAEGTVVADFTFARK